MKSKNPVILDKLRMNELVNVIASTDDNERGDYLVQVK